MYLIYLLYLWARDSQSWSSKYPKVIVSLLEIIQNVWTLSGLQLLTEKNRSCRTLQISVYDTCLLCEFSPCLHPEWKITPLRHVVTCHTAVMCWHPNLTSLPPSKLRHLFLARVKITFLLPCCHVYHSVVILLSLIIVCCHLLVIQCNKMTFCRKGVVPTWCPL